MYMCLLQMLGQVAIFLVIVDRVHLVYASTQGCMEEVRRRLWWGARWASDWRRTGSSGEGRRRGVWRIAVKGVNKMNLANSATSGTSSNGASLEATIAIGQCFKYSCTWHGG